MRSQAFDQLNPWLPFGVLLSLFCLGCSSADLSSVSGKVTFQTKPVEQGSLRFDPIQGTEGPTGTSPIQNGQYSISTDQGMVAGKYLVTIYATRETGRRVKTRQQLKSGAKTAPQTVQYIPEEYNSKSKLQVELKPRENTEDFNLK